EPLHLFDHLGQPCPALKLATGSGVPPREKELLPLRPAHRAHLSATPVARVAVDAREQPPRAPLLAAGGLELPADREAARAQALQSAQQGPVREPAARRQIGDGYWAGDLEVAAREGIGRLVLVEDARGARRGRTVRHERCISEQDLDLAAALCRRPPGRPFAGRMDLERPAGGGERSKELVPLLLRPNRDEREQHVVQLLCVTHIRGGLRSDPIDRTRIQPAELTRLHRKAAAQRYRARAALADLGVLVQIRKRRAVQDLVR